LLAGYGVAPRTDDAMFDTTIHLSATRT